MAAVAGSVYCDSNWKKLHKKKHNFQITVKVLHSVLKKF